MLMELTVIPLARGRSLSSDLAELIGLIDESGLPYKVTEFGTVVEGSWEELMAIAKICHVAIREKTDRVLILIRLDDYGDRTNLLSTTIAHVEQHLGRQVRK
ncbi:MAG TPA: MTH1187 family thiamine-binding protein [Candidatus Sulfotelmatobacter sp.]|nr:MTH1187 family thiamine-binding protein [Candidatus Sulfotelmatobacter sp.]